MGHVLNYLVGAGEVAKGLPWYSRSAVNDVNGPNLGMTSSRRMKAAIPERTRFEAISWLRWSPMTPSVLGLVSRPRLRVPVQRHPLFQLGSLSSSKVSTREPFPARFEPFQSQYLFLMHPFSLFEGLNGTKEPCKGFSTVEMGLVQAKLQQ